MTTHIDRYEIRQGLGRGAMGSVYLAYDPKVAREVAIKVLRESFAQDPKHRQRFEREARAIAALKHPNIVEIYDFGGSPEEYLYLVMEYIKGPHLGRLCEQHGPLPEVVLAACGLELGAALAHAHNQGVIHRDLKPENVFLERGRIVLADFGIVKAISPESPLGPEAARHTTEIIGTPGFMAPEQLAQGQLDARTDLFAMGAMFYYLATMRLPYDAKSPFELLQQIRGTRPEPIVNLRHDYSSSMARLIGNCLAVEPSRRPASAEAVRQDLRSILGRYGITDAREVLRTYEADSQDPACSRGGARR